MRFLTGFIVCGSLMLRLILGSCRDDIVQIMGVIMTVKGVGVETKRKSSKDRTSWNV